MLFQALANRPLSNFHKSLRAEPGNQLVKDNLAISVVCAGFNVLLLASKPFVQIIGKCLYLALTLRKLHRARRVGEGRSIIKRTCTDCIDDGRPMRFRPLQVSGCGLEWNPLTAADATEHKRDFDTRFRGGFNTSPVSTHSSYPFTSINIRLSGALIHTFSSGQMPSRIFVRIASSV